MEQVAETMEPPSDPPRRGCVPWQGLLLTVSLVTFWNPPATAQLTVESVPPNAVEGKDVLLLIHNLPQDALGYNWYKGDKVDSSYRIVGYVTGTQVNTTGPAYSGRETIYPNGSLLFQNITLNDTGHYTLQLIKANLQNEEVTGQLCVYSKENVPGLPLGAIAGIVTGVLAGVALVATLGCVLFLRRTARASGQRDLKERQPPQSTSGPAPWDSGTPSAPRPGPRAAGSNYEELLHPDTNVYCQIDHRADVAS
ncbi:carcinoembryonic antigen-related cell adhesion molecule 3-like [Lemur catta]|uniref:carcinoembryonic antigen-related cell adhesion molecule 3-like n=1 Tax=Lemur catta TaxID=9447 RepID=UPI001E26C922|nr:carcinoembryonic antigen-related cell adhesion molecule 3-like [Lemur catta]